MSAVAEPRHKFAIGDHVKIAMTIRGIKVEGNVFTVSGQLPSENNDFQYRLRSLDGRFERITFESQLVRAEPPPAADSAKGPAPL